MKIHRLPVIEHYLLVLHSKGSQFLFFKLLFERTDGDDELTYSMTVHGTIQQKLLMLCETYYFTIILYQHFITCIATSVLLHECTCLSFHLPSALFTSIFLLYPFFLSILS